MAAWNCVCSPNHNDTPVPTELSLPKSSVLMSYQCVSHQVLTIWKANVPLSKKMLPASCCEVALGQQLWGWPISVLAPSVLLAWASRSSWKWEESPEGGLLERPFSTLSQDMGLRAKSFASLQPAHLLLCKRPNKPYSHASFPRDYSLCPSHSVQTRGILMVKAQKGPGDSRSNLHLEYLSLAI